MFCEEWRNRVCSWMGSPAPPFSLAHLPVHLWCTWSLKLSRCETHTEYSCWLPTLLRIPGRCVRELLVAPPLPMKGRFCSWGCRPMRGSVLPPFGDMLATDRKGKVQEPRKAPSSSPVSPTTSAPNISHPALITLQGCNMGRDIGYSTKICRSNQ